MEYLNKTIIENEDDSSDYSDNEESNDIDYDTIQFETPVKNKDNLYIANLEEKIVIELDNLDVFEYIEEDNKKYVFFNLDLDNEDQEELIELLYNLDEVAVDSCFDHSVDWFNQKLSEEQIENLYIPLYIDNYKEKNHILMKVEINPDIDISNINHSNINVIEIKGLIFYKKTFLYHVYLDKIIEDTINIELNIDNRQKENKEKEKTKDNETKEDETKEDETREDETREDETKEEKVNKDVKETDGDKEEKKNEKPNIKELIEKKRLLVEENFKKTEKINKDAELLRIQAIQSANELKELERKLDFN